MDWRVVNEFFGEIAYIQDVRNKESVHSDIYSEGGSDLTDEFKKFLHDCLDEWINKSNGTGIFWVGDPDYFKEYE
jgi:hypothetical protein